MDAGDQALMEALGFDGDDLAANRAGRLSAMQEYRLRVRRQRAALVGFAAVLAGVFIATGLIFAGSRSDSPLLHLTGIGITLCNAALTHIFARHWARLTADIRGGSVQAATGPLERILRPVSRRVAHYVIRVQQAEVYVSEESFRQFEHRARYTLYRTPHTGTLLAAEKLDPQ